MSNVRYFSGDFTVARAVGALRNESPLLPELNDVLIFHQDFMQLGQYFAALDYNEINPDLLNAAYLFNESPREDIGGGVVKWTRSWVRIPNTYGKAGGTYPYTFPGFDAPDEFNTRTPRQLPVAMEITREFFLCGNHGVYASWQQIPIIKAFAPYEINPNDATDKTCVTDTLRDASGTDPGTSPSLTQYKAMIAAGQTLQVEDSKVTNFRGGVYMREMFTVIAQ